MKFLLFLGLLLAAAMAEESQSGERRSLGYDGYVALGGVGYEHARERRSLGGGHGGYGYGGLGNGGHGGGYGYGGYGYGHGGFGHGGLGYGGVGHGGFGHGGYGYGGYGGY